MAEIAKRLTAARRRRGWTREALAFHAGVSWSAIAQLESGRRRSPRPETLVALAGALGVTVGYLVGEDPDAKALDHRALLFPSDQAFLDGVTPFVLEGLARSEPVLVVVAERHEEPLRGSLEEDGRVTFAPARDWYTSPLDAIARYRSWAQELLDREASWVRIVGQPIDGTDRHTHADRWATYEAIFNMAFRPLPVVVVCLYDTRTCAPAVIEATRRTHPLVDDGDGAVDSQLYMEPEAFLLSR
jgi:transcriptional regulator with XRE-family HTH domain